MKINVKGCLIKRCTKCLINLTDKNWSNCNQKEKNYLCKNCERKMITDYNRKNSVGSTYKILKGNKRPYPKDQKCELCHKVKKLLTYHHWNDKDLRKGIWVCNREHLYITGYEYTKLHKTFIKKYLKLKNKLTRS